MSKPANSYSQRHLRKKSLQSIEPQKEDLSKQSSIQSFLDNIEVITQEILIKSGINQRIFDLEAKLVE